AANGRSVPEKVALLIQMLEALAYLHRRGILHRDLKPDNVLVMGDTVRMLDFGLAAAKEQATDSVGSWFYMAPEVLLGQPATEASDLYAVGILAYQLFVNEHPFDIFAPDIIGEILDEEPDWEKLRTEEEITAVVQNLLCKKPEQRIQGAKAAIAALHSALGQTVILETAVIRESYLQAATFVGREKEMQQLTAALSQAQAGQGSAWLVGGESGVGKTRLLRELEILARVNGFLVLRGQAVPDGGGLPYQIWREALRHLLVISSEVDNLTASVLLPLVPDIGQLIGQDVQSAPAIEENGAQLRLFTTIARFFCQQNQPILLILEDLQWAGESLMPLSYLTRLVAEQTLLIIGDYRNDERPELPEQVADMQLLHLPRLSQNDVAKLSTAILGKVGQQAELLALLQKETEGNTFFLIEVVRALAEEAGQLTAIGRAELPESLMPDGIQTIIKQRLERVPLEAQPLLKLTAVAGRHLDLALLRGLAPKINVDNWWLSVCAEAAVLEVQNNQWQFSHDKLREGLLAQLEPAQLQQHHAQVANGLEILYGQDANYAAQLAYHWGQAGDKGQERHYVFLAGKQAAAQYANDEALNYLTQALMLTPDDDWAGQYEVRLARESVYSILGAREEQATELEQLTHLTTIMADSSTHQMDILLRQAKYALLISQFDTAVAFAQEAVALSTNLHEDRRVADAYLTWGEALDIQGQYEEAHAALKQGLTLCRQVGDQKHEAAILRELGFVGAEMAAYEQTRHYCEVSLAITRAIGDRWEEGKTLNTLGTQAAMQGSFDEAITWFEASLQAQKEVGDRHGEAATLGNLGIVATLERVYDQAETYHRASLAIDREMGNQMGEFVSLSNWGFTLIGYGAYEAACKRIIECYTLAKARGYQSVLVEAASNLGNALAYCHKYDQAHVYLLEAANIAHDLGLRNTEHVCLYNLGHFFHLQDQYEVAQTYYQQALSISQEVRSELAVQNQAALAHVALALGQDPTPYLTEALFYCEQDSRFTGVEYPGRVYSDLYRTLQRMAHPRTSEILMKAYNFVQEMAGNIKDEAIRQSLLENVPEYREFVQLYEGE
ncbi:MAG: AAA family ATPase, partial [Anaerolineales bacterium]|nr:AAA family ATPase [Anaerolineales bacterium]